ncbi:blast:Elongation of very long chain fatty acids protein 1 [Drosophila guanche]|uniref:Elongation of very long chain fatty acids protein n=1 Tax=Drosophila guanche TaxID=7266 RepID=A0A3B0JR27_DROGU|nr:blast:Elongation of very long chain fatty acids protein 1 [Drosophila guanche]
MFDILNAPPVDPFGVPLLGSHWPILTIVAVYLLFTLKVGRKLMENREPFDLRGVIKVYNIVQILYNGIMLVSSLLFMLNTYDLKCVTNLPMDHEWKNTERWLTYSYFLNKILDLLDTIFFVLRKKHGHLTFLHIFHHSIMPYICFTYIRFYGHGGHGFFLCFFNVSVHVFMYTYYYISSRNLQESLCWKKYLTLTQLIQFMMMFLNCAYTYFQPNCNASRGVIYLICTMFVMFTKFDINTYIRPKKVRPKGTAH